VRAMMDLKLMFGHWELFSGECLRVVFFTELLPSQINAINY